MSTRMDSNGLKNAWSQWMSGLGNVTQGPASQVYKEWETWFAGQFEKLARNESFLGQVGKALESSFLAKSQFDRMMETSVRAMGMPTASDLEGVYKRLDSVERRLDEVLAHLEAQAARGEGAPAAPKAGKRPTPKATTPTTEE